MLLPILCIPAPGSLGPIFTREILKIARYSCQIETGENLQIPYDTLVLAVGSHYQVPPIAGTDLNGVHGQ